MILILLFLTIVAAILFAVFFIQYWRVIFWTLLVLGIIAGIMFANATIPTKDIGESASAHHGTYEHWSESR